MNVKELIDASYENHVVIHVKSERLREVFGDESDSLILVGGAIATPERFAKFQESLAHLCDDGSIMRYHQVIGGFEDIHVDSITPL